METFGFCLAKLRVRFPAPHPFLLLLLFLLVMKLLSVSANAAEPAAGDHYAAAPDTLASVLASDESLASLAARIREVMFGVGFTYDGSLITHIGNYDFRNRADGVQELATELYDVTLGIKSAFDSLDLASSSWLEKIYNSLNPTGESSVYDLLRSSKTVGNQTSYISIADLTADLLARNTVPAWDSNGNNFTGRNIADLLAQISRNQYFGDAVGFYLDADGSAPGFSGYINLGNAVGRGFLGLARLMFGNESHEIYGLGFDGFDKTGKRGDWSLADISANGFSGLASLIAGPDSWRDSYVWLSADGYDADGRTGLMQMVGEGYLGLASLFMGSRDKNDQQWPFMTLLSPDDGTSIISALSYHDLGHLLADGLTALQNPLARLAYVHADQDDIDFKKQETPNTEAVKDEFFGDGQGAVKPSDIKEAAGISSGLSDMFSGAGSPSDFFTVIGDSNSWLFFSEDVYNDLHGVSVPSSRDLDDFHRHFYLGEDGFYHMRPGAFDIDAYLEEARS